jgi:hypothetical protein
MTPPPAGPVQSGLPSISSRHLACQKEKFDRLNKAITKLGGWITSIPGAREVTIECLPASELPDRLRKAGYDLTEIDGGERIIPGSITELLTLSSSGAFEAATENSTKSIYTRTHSGVCRVRRYRFTIA